MQTQRDATLVVIEFGAAWPRWLEPGYSGDLAVVAQHYEGHPRSLITQVASRVTRLEAGCWRLGSIVLVSNANVDRDATAARSVLVRGLAARLGSAGGGQLVLTVAERASQRAKNQLMALAAALDGDAAKSRVSLGVRIGGAAPIYGTGGAPQVARAS